jgi:uncharacterized protein (DUF1499 family)
MILCSLIFLVLLVVVFGLLLEFQVIEKWGTNFCEKTFILDQVVTIDIYHSKFIKAIGDVQGFRKIINKYIELISSTNNEIYANYTTNLFKFNDNIYLKFTVSENSLLIYANSSSSFGRYDFGGNEANINKLRDSTLINKEPNFKEIVINGCGKTK